MASGSLAMSGYQAHYYTCSHQQVPNAEALGYTVGRKLGSGNFAVVMEARLSGTSKNVSQRPLTA